MPSNVVSYAEGYILQTYAGEQTEDSLRRVLSETAPLIDRTKAEGSPILILVDISRLGRLTTDTRKVAVDALARMAYDKVAVYGANTFARALVNLIAHAAGKVDTVKVFKTKDEALTWLDDNDTKQRTKTSRRR